MRSQHTHMQFLGQASLQIPKLQYMCSNAWLAFLRIPIPDTLFKALLPTVTKTVITSIKNPLALSDFLTKATDQGGLVGILALQGLFVLVTQHGLEHPGFYNRLYALLTPQVLSCCHCFANGVPVNWCLQSCPGRHGTNAPTLVLGVFQPCCFAFC